MRLAAHKTVAHVAEELAQSVYERLALNDAWYADNRDRRAFVKRCAPTLRAEARKILAEMLQRDDVSEHEKAEIYDALLLDRTLPDNGTGYQQ